MQTEVQKTLIEGCARSLAECNIRKPQIHCITNTVAASLTANTLLAIGARPSMTLTADEVTEFVHSAQALSINLGTLDTERRHSIPIAIQAAQEKGLPWILDPVLIHRASSRLRYAHDLIALNHPTVIRGNTAELEALNMTYKKALEQDCVVATTGTADHIQFQDQHIHILNGHPMMDRVTAIGCAETALIAAFCSIEPNPVYATAQAILAFNIAGDIAAETAAGPGSFEARLLDALYQLDKDQLQERARIT